MNLILKTLNPKNVYIISKTDNQWPLKNPNQSNEILSLEEYENCTVIFDDMVGSKEAKHNDQFFYKTKTSKYKCLLYKSKLL